MILDGAFDFTGELANFSVYELACILNSIIKEKYNPNLTLYDTICLDTRWNETVMELWTRMPHLATDPNLQPVLTEIPHGKLKQRIK